MHQPCELKMYPTKKPCTQVTGKKNRKCNKPGFAKLDGGGPRCKHHLEEQMDWIENISRKKGTKDAQEKEAPS